MVSKSKRVYRISEIAESAVKKRSEVFVKGFSCGFHSGEDLISYRIGYSTGIYSYSAQGKTQFYIEQAVFLSRRYGKKHAVWLTESGRKEELMLDIAMTYMGKSLYKGMIVTDEEIFEAFSWMNEHFFIIDHENAILNIRDIYERVGEIETEYKIKIDFVAIDNASNLSREDDKTRMMTHEYMNYLMTAINRTSLKKQYHTFVLFHVSKTDKVECKHTGKKYQPCPDHYDISGGQQINYLGYQLVCVWRPISKQEQYGIINPETGVPFELNETHVVITKSKPKAVGMQGKFVIYFDEQKQQFYEKINGQVYPAGAYDEEFGTVKPLPKPEGEPIHSWYDPAKEKNLFL